MSSLRGCSVVLIQPPDPVPAATAVDSGGGVSLRFSPPWDLLCLRAFLLNRTSHPCRIVDTRLFDQFETKLKDALRDIAKPAVAVIPVQTTGLGEASAVIDVLHRNYPDMLIVTCGQHPSDFPELALSLPHVRYALCGDPEPILRNLLDYHDIERRLHLTPGLASAGNPVPQPYWLPDLRSLNVADWTHLDWAGYASASPAGLRADIRLSRGHPRSPADVASGQSAQPLREWPLDRAAAMIQRCAHHGIVEVFLGDSPGYWTEQRLIAWSKQLITLRSTQAWSAQILPRMLSENALNFLFDSRCRRMEILFPSCDPERLKTAGALHEPAKIAAAIATIRKANIDVNLRFWVGGPHERPRERDRILAMIRLLDDCPYFLYPYPYEPTAPVFQTEDSPVLASAGIQQWLSWAKEPWLAERPTAFWSGKEGADACQQVILDVQRKVHLNPGRRLRKTLRHLRSIDWIVAWERRALALFAKRLES
ncbi:MAG TPA: hypothetical protein PKE55_00665 [Kiritimatiellia bacterium]|nr:hypothetical protein [Kiritimatiellia bacterium]